MPRPGLEDEMSLSEDVAREFKHVKESQDRIEQHLDEQDRHLSDHFKKFQQHVLDDKVHQINLEAHLIGHREQNRHRWAIYLGIIVTAASTIGLLAVEILKFIFMKG
jgi:hypothetical protein